MSPTTSLFAFLLGLLPLLASAQAQTHAPNPRHRLVIRPAGGRIVLDGRLTERDWQLAPVARRFWRHYPDDTSLAARPTEVRLTYDRHHLYVGIVAFQRQEYVVQSLRRDFGTGGNADAVVVNIDPFGDRQNAFHFAVNPYGVQREGLVSNGDHLSTHWDNRWFSRVTNLPDRWVVEMAIPFKTLRYRDEATEWGINFFRYNQTDNERSSWVPIPRGFGSSDLAFSGTLAWQRPPPRPGLNLALIPYALGSASHDHLGGTSATTGYNVGFDAKIGLTPALHLDLTVNPDFAQVEVDQQVTNLSRFELHFPERRQFFTENADLFGTFGFSKANPFFSRRIGLARSPVSGQLEPQAIPVGLKLSGKLNDRWRVGLLTVQTAPNATLGVRGANYTVATAQYRVFARSNVGGIVVNRLGPTGYNTVLGADYNLASAGGAWQGKLFYHTLLLNHNRPGQYASGARLEYASRRFGAETEAEAIGRNYTPEVGFVPRRGIARASQKLSYTYLPKGSWRERVNALSLAPEADLVYGLADRRVLDAEAGVSVRVKFQNTASLKVTPWRWEYVYLFSPFDPSGRGDADRALPEGTEYRFTQGRVQYQSDGRQPFHATVEGRFGRYFNGNLLGLHAHLHHRLQPVAQFGLEAGYTRIRLPDGFNDADLWLLGPRADLTFTKNLYFTALAQYNSQNNNLGFNARLQWRFRPVSDFFLVYTDNYFTQGTRVSDTQFFEPFQPKNRALVAKLTYWFSP